MEILSNFYLTFNNFFKNFKIKKIQVFYFIFIISEAKCTLENWLSTLKYAY